MMHPQRKQNAGGPILVGGICRWINFGAGIFRWAKFLSPSYFAGICSHPWISEIINLKDLYLMIKRKCWSHSSYKCFYQFITALFTIYNHVEECYITFI